MTGIAAVSPIGFFYVVFENRLQGNTDVSKHTPTFTHRKKGLH
jgi:hypothetical protein